MDTPWGEELLTAALSAYQVYVYVRQPPDPGQPLTSARQPQYRHYTDRPRSVKAYSKV